jgi:hypothetical protein
MAPCYGPGCCDVGTSWDNTAKKCIPGAGGRVSGGTASWNAGTSSLTISLKVSTALIANDTITITLPSGLFSGTPAALTGNFTGQPSVSSSFPLTVNAGGVSDSNTKVVPLIIITGMTISPNAYTLSKQLTVKTTKDINPVGIAITGISS